MVTFLDDLNNGLRQLLSEDENVYLLGEDILDPYGGAFKVTKGLSSAFPGRVITTPISEAAIVGIAGGMALRGLHPIVEIMFGDFVTLIVDQLVNYAAKYSLMYAGQAKAPFVVRTPMGGGRGYGPTHSQSLEKLFLGVPNLTVVAPSHYHFPGEMIKKALYYGSGPVLFVEHKLLYPAKLPSNNVVVQDGINIEDINDENGFSTIIARNYQAGLPDVTVVCYGGMSLVMEKLMVHLAKEEIRLLCCIPGSLSPLPAAEIISCAKETGRVVVVEEGTAAFGWGSQVSAIITEALWGKLQVPVRRIGAFDSIIPAARSIEAGVLPSFEKIEEAIYEVMI